MRIAALVCAALALAGCGGGDDEAAPPPAPPAPTETRSPVPPHANVRLQLGASPAARYAGYYAAEAQGYYEQEDVDVAIAHGEPREAVVSGLAELGVEPLAALLAARKRGDDLVNVAQVFRDGGDGIFVRDDWVGLGGNGDVAARFLRASFRGWIFCRDLPADCARIVEANARRIDEVNALVWPSELGIGIVDELDARKRGATAEAYRTDLAEQALVGITDDVHAPGWTAEGGGR